MASRCWVPAASGPLARYAAGYGTWLAARGYSRWTIAHRLWQLELLSRWLECEGFSPSELTLARVEAFLAARRAAGYSSWVSARSTTLPLEYLRELGAVPLSASTVDGPLERLLADFGRYLLDERGLTEGTVEHYVPAARLFLTSRASAELGGLERLSGADVSLFLAAECPKRGVAAARTLTCGLRSLLGWLYLTGRIADPLVWAVPAVADLRDRSLPRGLDAATVKRLLTSCDRRRTVGRRDYAVLLLLSRLGLRAGEVAAITLDDIDWRVGELLVRNRKGRRVERLPLPADVGEAIVSYLRRRPRVESRAVFLRVIAPVGGIDRLVVAGIVLAACRRAALPRVGAHRLRHTAATEMLRAGASLSEIGHVLRHRDVRTTARYAKVDRAALRRIARPWPEGCGMTSLHQALEDYLRTRRQLGFQLKADQLLLENFVAFMKRTGAETITSELAVMWARMPVDAHPHHWSRRLSIVRCFARYVATLDPESEIPSTELLRAHRPRVAPYIYSPAEITALIEAAGQLTPPLRAASYRTVIGLMATTGLRLGEALGLDHQDVDLAGALHVRAGKPKQREVPLHPTATSALGSYARQRDRRWPSPQSEAFFLNATGDRLAKPEFNYYFAKLIGQIGLEGAGERVRPRPHDLRHTMAVRTLLDWVQAGEDVDRRMPELSTFLGHVQPESTYWYLQAVPELMALTAARLPRLPEVLP